ncbi:type II toxin-antitoxin system VapC family toxin [Oscillatoria amoena NRMC-F 0135]|nr:type II toxin-antitoxin system VapC family toxin [Oscillatoria laete-virens]MDL5049109.1 type II toxin-antitoxin system VapC family toxin [Oscillatoria amoena NRMC-F 0135]MDL5054007.1 type II toxin-antitoxin system VapC family toxin [Oscillatoria laete-virens NRMC-F 0139]
MNLLLDTHVFLWMLSSPERLNSRVAARLRDPRNSVFVSAISSVEIAIKRGLGKLQAPDNLSLQIEKRGLLELPFQYRHGETLSSLPPHHADPFDRMLIAQAVVEELTLVTHDRKMEPYPIHCLWT